jgi:hypothetical protein
VLRFGEKNVTCVSGNFFNYKNYQDFIRKAVSKSDNSTTKVTTGALLPWQVTSLPGDSHILCWPFIFLNYGLVQRCFYFPSASNRKLSYRVLLYSKVLLKYNSSFTQGQILCWVILEIYIKSRNIYFFIFYSVPNYFLSLKIAVL